MLMDGLKIDIENKELFIDAANNSALFVETSFSCSIPSTTLTRLYDQDRVVELLVRGINNRTRERNYFKKYCELLEGTISEGEFDKEVENHEDDYVVPTNQPTDREDIMIALDVSDKIKDVNYVEDLESLFSFNSDTLRLAIQ